MRLYILILYTLLCVMGINAQTSKLSPFVQRAVRSESVRVSKARHLMGKSNAMAAPWRAITAFVRTSDTEALRSQGCRIYAQWDDIVIAAIPLNKVMALASMPQVMRIEAGQSCSVTNDYTSLLTRTRDVWQSEASHNLSMSTPLTGKGVVVGVMDVGFDLTHPTYYSADMSEYRIKAFWDQLDTLQTGLPVIGRTAEGLDTIYLGRQYTTMEELLAKAHATDGFICTHGTHTSGTAAGSGCEGTVNALSSRSSNAKVKEVQGDEFYSGMAPGADICLVCNYAGDNAELVPDSLLSQYTTATDMLGFKYIFDYADSQGKPCVINFSEGTHDDMYESQLYSEVLSKMIGPGHIICCAAGNEAWHNNYVSKPAGTERAGAFLTSSSTVAYYTLSSSAPAQFDLTFYPSDTDRQAFSFDMTAITDYPDSVFTDTITVADQTYCVYTATYPSCYDSTRYAVELCIVNMNKKSIDSSLPVSLTLTGTENDIEVFSLGGYFTTNDLDATLNNADNTHCILFPSSSKDVICVGNVAYRQGFYNYEGIWRDPFEDGTRDGIISIYSSRGPAISGLTKPDVCAPGMNIISSFSSYYREANPTSDLINEARQFTFNGRHYAWEANSGTSMSSPVVAGIIALWLQVCPTLTPDEIRDVFAHSCTHYDESLTYPNNTYGYGTIDALAGLEYIQKTYTGIEQMENGDCKMENAVYTLDGRKVNSVGSQHGIFIVTENGVTRKVIR